jgi:hypothetical protein
MKNYASIPAGKICAMTEIIDTIQSQDVVFRGGLQWNFLNKKNAGVHLHCLVICIAY